VPVPGIDPLREALSVYLKDMGAAEYGASRVLVTAGIQESRFLSIQMIGDQFDSIALPQVVHPGARKAAGVRPLAVSTLPVEAENGMLPSVSSIRECLESGCSLLYLESPSRLTGAIFDTPAVQKIAALLQEFDAAAIWDQGLAPWVQDGAYTSLGAQPGMAERVALLGEAWPGMGLESWQIGYIAANEEWWEYMRSQKQIMSICTSTPSQFAAVKAAELYTHLHPEQQAKLAEFKQQALKQLSKLNAKWLRGATVNLVALQASDTRDVAAALDKNDFRFADGADFGAPDVLRLSITSSNAINAALNQLA
jgi:aspartate/methionine/tyrosine aminotransferase